MTKGVLNAWCREVRSLALAYLRVVTGCMDGKLRVFSLLNGDCLRVIKAGSNLNPILSVHFHGNKYVSLIPRGPFILSVCLMPLQNKLPTMQYNV